MSSEVKRFYPSESMPGAMRECEDGGFCQATDYAALEAENARLAEQVKKWQALAQNVETLERITESAEARRSQLAAIQGGMGEVVEVVARLMHWKGRHQNPWKVVARTYSECASYAYPKDWEEGAQLMTVAQHQRITAAMAAEVERLRTALSKANEQTEHFERNWYLVSDERDALRAELAEVKGQEAVAWLDPVRGLDWLVDRMTVAAGTKLYALPPASTDVEGLVKALEAADEYLSDNRFNEIGSGSILHRQMKDALSTWRQAQV